MNQFNRDPTAPLCPVYRCQRVKMVSHNGARRAFCALHVRFMTRHGYVILLRDDDPIDLREEDVAEWPTTTNGKALHRHLSRWYAGSMTPSAIKRRRARSTSRHLT
jgi:hypothetical protein